MKKSLVVAGGSLLLGLVAGLLLLLGFQSGTSPSAVITQCKVSTGTVNKEILLHTFSTTQDRAFFVSTDDKYRIDFNGNSPFPDDSFEIDLYHPKQEVMKLSERLCTNCYFPFTFYDETTHTACADPGVHITR